MLISTYVLVAPSLVHYIELIVFYRRLLRLAEDANWP